MSKLPPLPAAAAIVAFRKAGFVEVRQTGSHRILKKEGHRFLLAVPDHGARDLKIGTLRSLIRDAGLSVEEFIGYLD